MPLSLSPALTAAAEGGSGTAPMAVTPPAACARPSGTPSRLAPWRRHPPHPRRSLPDCTGRRKGPAGPEDQGVVAGADGGGDPDVVAQPGHDDGSNVPSGRMGGRRDQLERLLAGFELLYTSVNQGQLRSTTVSCAPDVPRGASW